MEDFFHSANKMSLFTSPEELSNEDPESEQVAFDFSTDFSRDGWIVSDQSVLVRPDAAYPMSALPIGDYSPSVQPASNNPITSYTTSSLEGYSPIGMPYVFGSGSSYNTPDTSFTPTPFDISRDSLSNSLSGFDIENFDIWPSNLLNTSNLYSYDNLMMEERGMPFLEEETLIMPLVAPDATENQQPNDNQQSSHLTNIEVTPNVLKTLRQSKDSSRSLHRRKSSTKSLLARRSPTTTPIFSPGSSTKDDDYRKNHNQIEKKYRTSMNDRFSILRACLPEAILGTDGGDNTKKIAKSDVLVAALKYVKELEQKGKELQEEKVGLVGSVGVWERQWKSTRGGG